MRYEEPPRAVRVPSTLPIVPVYIYYINKIHGQSRTSAQGTCLVSPDPQIGDPANGGIRNMTSTSHTPPVLLITATIN